MYLGNNNNEKQAQQEIRKNQNHIDRATRQTKTYSDLIVTGFGHVSYPLDRLIVVLLKDLQEPNQQS